MQLLEIKDLHVRYGAVEVLKGISMEVQEGEMVALIGANGAGKTTTFMVISGLVPAAQGSVRFAGELIERWPAEKVARRGITQVPEGRRIFPRLTVRENLLLGAEVRNDRSNIQRDLEWVAALFPLLKNRWSQFAGTLSGGEQQMLALARGLMSRPRLLLLDEPSLGLAPKVVTGVFQAIREIHRSGITVLLVEQNAYQALQVSQRAYVLQTGQVVLQGIAERLAADPQVKKAYLGG